MGQTLNPFRLWDCIYGTESKLSKVGQCKNIHTANQCEALGRGEMERCVKVLISSFWCLK